MFPINPVPYIIPYVIFFFLLPWSVFVIKLVSEIYYLYRNKKGLNIYSYKDAMRITKSNPEFLKRYKDVKKWLLITIIIWLIAFFSLIIILRIMEYNNLLINHSKGIYGQDEKHKFIFK
jgi:hypothetical protein